MTSKEKIKDAYKQLLYYKNFNKISVSDIVKSAQINRSTFYRHYTDIFSVYRDVCRDLINECLISNGAVYDISTLANFVIDLHKNFVNRIDEIRRLSCNDKSNAFLYDIRNSFSDCLKTKSKAAGVYGDEVKWLIVSSADYLLLDLTVKTTGYRTQNGVNKIKVNYTYDLTKDPYANIANVIHLAYGGNSDFQYSLLLAIIRLFSKIGFRDFSITDLLNVSGYSRTEFYILYRNKDEFLSKLWDVVGFVTVESITPLLSYSSAVQFESVLDYFLKYRTEIEHNLLLKGLQSGYMLGYWVDIVYRLYNSVKDNIYSKIGSEKAENIDNTIMFIVSSTVSAFGYFACTDDKKAFLDRMETIYKFRDSIKI